MVRWPIFWWCDASSLGEWVSMQILTLSATLWEQLKLKFRIKDKTKHCRQVVHNIKTILDGFKEACRLQFYFLIIWNQLYICVFAGYFMLDLMLCRSLTVCRTQAKRAVLFQVHNGTFPPQGVMTANCYTSLNLFTHFLPPPFVKRWPMVSFASTLTYNRNKQSKPRISFKFNVFFMLLLTMLPSAKFHQILNMSRKKRHTER